MKKLSVLGVLFFLGISFAQIKSSQEFVDFYKKYWKYVNDTNEKNSEFYNKFYSVINPLRWKFKDVLTNYEPSDFVNKIVKSEVSKIAFNGIEAKLRNEPLRDDFLDEMGFRDIIEFNQFCEKYHNEIKDKLSYYYVNYKDSSFFLEKPITRSYSEHILESVESCLEKNTPFEDFEDIDCAFLSEKMHEMSNAKITLDARILTLD